MIYRYRFPTLLALNQDLQRSGVCVSFYWFWPIGSASVDTEEAAAFCCRESSRGLREVAQSLIRVLSSFFTPSSIVALLCKCWDRDSGTEHGNYYGILGFYRDNGTEHGNYHGILGF